MSPTLEANWWRPLAEYEYDAIDHTGKNVTESVPVDVNGLRTR